MMDRLYKVGAAWLLSTCCAVLLGSCGGAVGAPPAPDPAAGTPLAVSPSTAELLPGVPATFTISGGRSGYSVFSSNSGVLPVTTSVTGSTFTVTPTAVTADTVVDITVRDAANASATAKVTVKFTGTPLTVSPSTADLLPGVPTTFTITGGRAGYSAFSSNSGALPIITANVTGSTFTVMPNAVTADMAVDITVRDATNAAVTVKVTIKFVPGAPLTISPSSADLLPGIPTTFTIAGGRAGYTAFSSNNSVLPITSNVNGSTFTVTPNAVAADTVIDITVRDAANVSATAKVTVKFTGSALAINPASADLFPGLFTTFTITGGRPGYTVFSSNNSVLPVTTNVSGATFTVIPNAVTVDTVVDITVRDAANASATAKVTVKSSGSALAISPASADVFAGLSTTFTITGGRPGYTVFSSNNSVLPITANVTGSTFTVTPNAVTADTVVDITVRDSINASATAKVTIKFVTGALLTISPSAADLFPGSSTTFTIAGGRPGYTAFSSNNSVLPITANITGSTFSVTPNSVSADTPIDITVRDALNASTTAKVTVKFTGAALAISPTTVTLFPDMPFTFNISGGSGPYSASSSVPAVLTVPASVTGISFSVTPNAVTADTAVDVTVRDAKGATVVAKVTVKPSSLLNQITFTTLAPTGGDCGTNTICAGGDAQVIVKASRNGVNLPNRRIRFEVFQGAFQIFNPASGTLVNSLEVLTNDQGEAIVRITANASASTQVATIQTTDVTDSASPLVRRYNFNIIRSVSGVAVLSVLPSASVTITGEKGNTVGSAGSCPTRSTVDYYIFGGTPPYNVASPRPDVASVSPATVATSGGKFTALITNCVTVSFVVSDASGRTLETSPLIAERGATGTGLPPSTFVVSPSSLTIACGTSGSVMVSGVGTYSTSVIGVTPGTGLRVTASTGLLSTTGTSVTISAIAGSVFSSPVVEFYDGTLRTSVAIKVTNATGDVVSSCP